MESALQKQTKEQLQEQLKQIKLERIKLLRQKQKYERENKLEFFLPPPGEWEPDPEKTAWYHNPHQAKLFKAWMNPAYKTLALTGGNRCLGGEVEIYDPVKDMLTPVSAIKNSFNVMAWDGKGLVEAEAEKPFRKYPIEPLYEIKTTLGGSFVASGGHRVLTPYGYKPISECQLGCELTNPQTNTSIITSKKHLRDDVKWDFTVPEYHNYYAGGAIHHNTGKTHTAVAIIISCLHGYWIWDEYKTPINQVPFKVLLIGQKWEDHIAKTLIPKLKELWPKTLPVKTKKNNQGVEHEWLLPNGSVLHLMSNKQEAEAFEGGDYDLIVPDEPCKEDVWDAATRGLIDRGGRALITASLLKEPWMDRNILKARLDNGRPDPSVFSILAKMTDNIGYGLTQKNVEAYKHRYRNNPELLRARIEGIPSYMSGLVWNLVRNQASGEGNLKDRFKNGVPLDWMIDIAIDVHPKEPQAALFLATSPKGYKYVVEEIFKNMSAKQLAQETVRVINLKGYRVNRIIIDPAAKSDENSPEGSMFNIIDSELSKFGYGPIYPGSKDLRSGIDLVKSWLMTENEEPALFIFNDCIRTIWEIEGWMWAPEKGKPIDKDDHMCENLRRLIQLDTKYYEMEDEDGEDTHYRTSNSSRNAWGGY